MNSKQLSLYREMLKYTGLAIGIGIIVGIIDAVFGRVLIGITNFRSANPMVLIPFLSIAGLIIIFLYRTFSKEALKGMTLIFETGFGENERIPKRLIPLVMFTTWITHLFGGSAGREGVAVQLGATVAHTVGKKVKIENGGRVLLLTGMAAGFGGLFQTPIAATFFAMEVLVAGALQYEALLPALVAAYVSSSTSHLLGLEKFAVDLHVSFQVDAIFILKLVVISIVFGLTGGVFAAGLEAVKDVMRKKCPDSYLRIFIVGICLSVVFLVLSKGRYSGLGTNLISAAFTDGKIYAYDWILKLALTVLTLAAGFQGGEVTPLFAIGASLGVVLGGLFGLPVMFVAALGYIAVFSSATKTLLAPIFIGVEVFGTEYVLYFAVVCVIAYLFNGSRTIYHLQRVYKFK
ncbi:MAG: chloride channel protein [bacterium]|nr:chloride channel protein [bacterium]